MENLHFKFYKRFGGRYIPFNEEAMLIAKLMKRRSLTPDAMEILKKLTNNITVTNATD